MSLLTSALLSSVVLAPTQTKTFNIVGERLQYRNLATVESVTDFETFTGRTSKVSGTITFDRAKKTGSGTIEVDVASINTGIDTRDEHMRSSDWLSADKYPTIKFVATKVQHRSGDAYTVTGNLTLRGVTKAVTAPTTVKFRPAGADTKAAGFDGDVLQVTTNFRIKLSDYGVKIPARAAATVSNEVAISVKAYALAK